MNKILDVVEDIKQNITDNQYKTIMDSLMEINDTDKLPLLTNNHKLNKISHLFSWLDTKIKISDNFFDDIKLPYLIENITYYKFAINKLFF